MSPPPPSSKEERAALADLERALRGEPDPQEIRALAEFERALRDDPFDRALPDDPLRASSDIIDPLADAPERHHAQELLPPATLQQAHVQRLFELRVEQWSAHQPPPPAPTQAADLHAPPDVPSAVPPLALQEDPWPSVPAPAPAPASAPPESPSIAPEPIRPPARSTGFVRSVPKAGALESPKMAVRCDACQRPLLAGLSFCAHCGGAPYASSPPRSMAVEIVAFQDEPAQRRLLAWLVEVGIPRHEAHAQLQRLPARFGATFPPDHAVGLEHWLREVGVEVRIRRAEDSPVAHLLGGARWLWARPQARVLGAVAAACLLTLAVVHSACWVAAAIPAALGVLMWSAGRPEAQRPLDLNRLLADFTGIPESLAGRARRLLQTTRDPDLRRALGAVLQNHHALHAQSRALSARWSGAFSDPSQTLERMLLQYLDAAERHLDLDTYLSTTSREEIDAQLHEIQQQSALSSEPREGARLAQAQRQLLEQRAIVAQLEEDRRALRDQLLHLSQTCEHLRARLLALQVRTPSQGAQADSPEPVLQELEAEIQILEETLHEIRRG